MLAKIDEVLRVDVHALQDVGQMVRDVAFFVFSEQLFLWVPLFVVFIMNIDKNRVSEARQLCCTRLSFMIENQ